MSKKRRKKRSRKRGNAAAKPNAKPAVQETQAAPAERATKTSEETRSPDAKLSGLDAWLFAGMDPARVFLLLRVTLPLLALDCFVDLVPHGGRYGVGAFNVAHFGWLDAILPLPTAAFYVGNLIFCGVLAFAMALRPVRIGMVALFISYTLGWSMSMLDSYQHHYLISLLLFSMMFFPLTTAKKAFEGDTPTSVERAGGFAFAFGAFELIGAATDVPTLIGALHLSDSTAFGVRATAFLFGLVGPALMASPGPRRVMRSWGYASIMVTCAIVYFYTAVTKLSPDWRDGHALRRLGRSDAFQALQAKATEGFLFLPPLEADVFWSLLAKGAIAVQLVSSLAFLQAIRIDEGKGKKWLPLLGLAPLSFHLGAETMGLQIGWFSYYMLLIVVVAFSPRASIHAAAEVLTLPFRRMATKIERDLKPIHVGGLVALAALILCATLFQVDLPGALGAGVYIAVGLSAYFVWALRNDRVEQVRYLPLAFVLAAMVAFLSMTQSSVRYDYYRFVGGDHRRRGEYEEALAAYEKANRYIVTPYCVFEGRERIDCYRTEADATARAEREGEGYRVEISDRREKEEEMRQRVERSRQ